MTMYLSSCPNMSGPDGVMLGTVIGIAIFIALATGVGIGSFGFERRVSEDITKRLRNVGMIKTTAGGVTIVNAEMLLRQPEVQAEIRKLLDIGRGIVK